MKALVFENKVVEIAEKEFPVYETMTWVDIPEGQSVVYGDYYRDGIFTKPEIAPVVKEIDYQDTLIQAAIDAILGKIKTEDLIKIYDENKQYLKVNGTKEIK